MLKEVQAPTFRRRLCVLSEQDARTAKTLRAPLWEALSNTHEQENTSKF